MRLPRPAPRETASLSSTGHSPGPRLPLARATGTAVREECADCPRGPRDGFADAGSAAMRAGMAGMAMVAHRGAMPSMRNRRRSADAGARRGPVLRDVPSGAPAPSRAACRCLLQRLRYPRIRRTDTALDAERPARRNPGIAPRRVWTTIARSRMGYRRGRQVGGTSPWRAAVRRARPDPRTPGRPYVCRRPARDGRSRDGGTCPGVTPMPRSTRWPVRPLSPPPGRGTAARRPGTAPRRPRSRTSRGRPPSPAR